MPRLLKQIIECFLSTTQGFLFRSLLSPEKDLRVAAALDDPVPDQWGGAAVVKNLGDVWVAGNAGLASGPARSGNIGGRHKSPSRGKQFGDC